MPAPLRVTAVAASAQLGGTERVLLDFAAHAFEHDIALRVLTPRDGPLIAILNQLGVPAEVVPGPDAMLRGSQQPSRLASLVPALLALPRWARDLSRHRFWADAEVIYTVAFKAHTAALLHHDRTTVWHLHEFPPALTGGVWKALARRSPNALIANSEAVATAWCGETRDVRRETRTTRPASLVPRLTVIPNGVDLDRFKPRAPTGWIHQRLGIPRGHRLIGMPAVFARWKGHELVLRAFDAVAAEFPDAHLVFVGGTIYDTVAEHDFGTRLSSLVPSSPRAHILPFQPDIERAYPEFDLITHYSLRPEPFGRVILESMACGVPVIAAAEGGPLEILGAPAGSREPGAEGIETLPGDETPEGWLVVPREPRALAATLRRALGLDKPALTAKGRAGRARAEERFSAREFARGVALALRSAHPASSVSP